MSRWCLGGVSARLGHGGSVSDLGHVSLVSWSRLGGTSVCSGGVPVIFTVGGIGISFMSVWSSFCGVSVMITCCLGHVLVAWWSYLGGISLMSLWCLCDV